MQYWGIKGLISKHVLSVTITAGFVSKHIRNIYVIE